MWNETSFRSESGVIREISVNGSSTGYIEDIKMFGPPSTDYDEGSCSYPAPQEPLHLVLQVPLSTMYLQKMTLVCVKRHKSVDAEVMNGDYQALAMVRL